MGKCFLCCFSEDLVSVSDTKMKKSVAFLKDVTENDLNGNILLCIFCQDNADAVMAIKEKYSMKKEMDDAENPVILTRTKLHSCMMCKIGFENCIEVQAHVIKCCGSFIDDSKNNDASAENLGETMLEVQINTPEFHNSTEEAAMCHTDDFQFEGDFLADSSQNSEEIDDEPENSKKARKTLKKTKTTKSRPKKRQTKPPAKSDKQEKMEKDSNKGLKCLVCHVNLSGDSFGQHVAEEHPEIQPSLPCGHCEKSFFTEDHLRWHFTNLGYTKSCFGCIHCGGCYLRYPEFTSHLKKCPKGELDRSEGIRLIYCCKQLWTTEELNLHLKGTCVSSSFPIGFRKCSGLKHYPKEESNECHAKVKEASNASDHNFTDLFCPVCGKNWSSFSDTLRCFMKAFCPICNKDVASSIDEHIARQHPVSLGNYCPKCDKSFDDMHEHMTKMHFGYADKSFSCDMCSSKFKTQANLRKHKDIVHLGNYPNSEVCETCGKIFKSRYELSRHLVSHSEDRNYQCKSCGKTFKHYSSHYLHVKYVHSKIKYVKCATCHAKFENQTELNEHLRVVHDNKKKFQCPECPWSFNHRSRFNCHVAQVHRGEKKHVCDVCGQRFGHGSSLTKHKRVHVRRGDIPA